MKTMIYTVCLSLGLMACSNGKTEQTTTKETVIETQKSDVIESYMNLKDGFVKSDVAAVKLAAGKLSKSLSSENMDQNLVKAATSIANADDIEAQRLQFKTITDRLIASLKSNDTEDGVFVQYCPMAFNNTGANWLSLTKEIRNPYFGDKMLKCGSVKEAL